MSKLTILGIQINERNAEAGKVQGVLTKYGCSIKTRLGLHETSSDHCSPSGLILLEMINDATEISKFEKDLSAIGGIIVKKMEF